MGIVNDQTTPLHVGDRVEGILSGNTGTVTKVHPSGNIDAVMENGDPWPVNLPRDRFFLIERAKPVMKIGDTVEYGMSDDYKVVGAHGDYLWIDRTDGAERPLTILATRCAKVEPFFEAGKTYNLYGSRFTVDRVESDDNGRKVAIGKGGATTGEWVCRRQFGGWREV